jgi:hypothetical protein
MRRAAAIVAGAALVLGGAAGALASSSGTPVVTLLAHQLTVVRGHDGRVPVLLPTTMRLPGPLHASRVKQGRGYQLVLGTAPHCDGSLVCAVAIFSAIPGARPYGSAVALSHGTAGAYTPFRCAGDCTEATIGWLEDGILYTIAARPKGAVKAALIAAADQAIDAGPR